MLTRRLDCKRFETRCCGTSLKPLDRHLSGENQPRNNQLSAQYKRPSDLFRYNGGCAAISVNPVMASEADRLRKSRHDAQFCQEVAALWKAPMRTRIPRRFDCSLESLLAER